MNVANERIQPLLYTRHEMVQLESDKLDVYFGLRIVFLTLCRCLARNFAIVRPCIVENHFLTCIAGSVLSKIHSILRFDNHEQAVNILNLKSVCFYCKVEDVQNTSLFNQGTGQNSSTLLEHIIYQLPYSLR